MTQADIRLAAAHAAVRHFGFGSHAKLIELVAGPKGVFRVDYNSERFVLRAQHDALPAAARAVQAAWLRAITLETPLYVPRPVAANETWALLRWVDGEPLAKPEAFVKTAVLERVGEAAATLHAHAASFRAEGIEHVRVIDADALVGPGSCLGDGSARRILAANDVAALEMASTKIADAMRRAASQAGLIHGDLGPANWIFQNGQPRLIDFDAFGRGPFLFDLLGVLWSHVAWDAYPSFRRALLAGYERVRPLSDDERDDVDVMQAATLMPWFNNGCRMTDGAGRAEFLKWAPSNVAAVARLCRMDAVVAPSPTPTAGA